MNLICPECKNDVYLSAFPNLVVDQTIECDTCGINLLLINIDGENVGTEIVDEGK